MDGQTKDIAINGTQVKGKHSESSCTKPRESKKKAWEQQNLNLQHRQADTSKDCELGMREQKLCIKRNNDQKKKNEESVNKTTKIIS